MCVYSLTTNTYKINANMGSLAIIGGCGYYDHLTICHAYFFPYKYAFSKFQLVPSVLLRSWSRSFVSRWQSGSCGKVSEKSRRTIWSNQSWEMSDCDTGPETQKDHLCSVGPPKHNDLLHHTPFSRLKWEKKQMHNIASCKPLLWDLKYSHI